MPEPTRVFVVEDDDALRELLTEELEERGHIVVSCADAESALSNLRLEPADAVISDLRLPGMGGLALLEQVRGLEDPPGFIAVTAFGTIDQAVRALKEGADDFLTKPLDFEHLALALERVLEYHRLRRQVARLGGETQEDDAHGLSGSSRSMARLREMIHRVAASDMPVLVSGESGTGKELVARAIHAESPRNSGPFIAVNCAGVPADLLESEFFGHLRGAFSGAEKHRAGLFQTASGGTLFLDEIGEMPFALQAKLLRVLEDGSVRPVGADSEQLVDVRVIAATHVDLESAVADERFRADLFYRLEGFRVEVPPLRERDEDIGLLAERFIRQISQRFGRPVPAATPEFLDALHRYPFPGNVRELINAMERAVTFSGGETLRPDHLPERMRREGGASLLTALMPEQGLPTLEAMERRYIDHVLRRVDGNKRKAAEILGIGRRTLYRRLDEA